jgi:16S rRNA (guanine1207-N2)-methyltransferase
MVQGEKNKMPDTLLQFLAQQAQLVSGPQLMIADENLKGTSLQALPTDNIALITNRFELNEQAISAGFNSMFNDFDFSGFADNHFEQILYRVSKEKLVTHHIINNARRLIKPGGTLILVGKKNDGIKAYTNKAGHYFGCKVKPKKQGSAYIAVIQKQTTETPTLNDGNYPKLRSCLEINNNHVLSKPGLFGWNKIDQGSAFLADHLPDFFQYFQSKPKFILDLGCGYGYLSLMASTYINAKFIATDNNAAAIAACSKNFLAFGIDGEVIAGNCAQNINQRFDAVLCNPPFHSGFGTDSQLTQQFVTSSYEHLNPGGKALFVANRFVPIESCAGKHTKLANIEKIAENKSFKLVLVSRGEVSRS